MGIQFWVMNEMEMFDNAAPSHYLIYIYIYNASEQTRGRHAKVNWDSIQFKPNSAIQNKKELSKYIQSIKVELTIIHMFHYFFGP